MIEQARQYASKDRQKDDAIETIGVKSVAGTAAFSGAGGRKVLGDKVWDLIPSHWYCSERRRPRLGQEVKIVDASVANAGWLQDVVEAVREVDDALELLVPVQLRRRSAVCSTTTGRRERFREAVTIQAKVEGYNRRLIDSEDTIETAKHRVTLYDTALVGTGDRLTWDGGDHTIVHVDGLLKDPAGGLRYLAKVLTN